MRHWKISFICERIKPTQKAKRVKQFRFIATTFDEKQFLCFQTKNAGNFQGTTHDFSDRCNFTIEHQKKSLLAQIEWSLAWDEQKYYLFSIVSCYLFDFHRFSTLFIYFLQGELIRSLTQLEMELIKNHLCSHYVYIQLDSYLNDKKILNLCMYVIYQSHQII